MSKTKRTARRAWTPSQIARAKRRIAPVASDASASVKTASALPSGNGEVAMSMKAWSAYDGANWSANRGWIYFPTLTTQRDLDDYTLRELRRKSRWLYVNVGLATRIIDGLSKMVGSLTPVPMTDDKEWNELALKKFTNDAGAEFVFDQGGKFNFWSAQPMLTACRLLDGDVLAVLTSTQSGIASVMFYEAHQVGNADTYLAQDQWQSGVMVNAQNRPLQYRILTEDGTKSVDISAADAMFHCLYRRSCRQRGEPVMRHAINHLLDRSEILGFLKSSMKNAATIGYQIVRSPQFTGPGTLPALNRGPVDLTVPASMGDGGTQGTAKVKVEDAFSMTKTPVMNPGEEIKMLLDERPHPNQIEGMDYLVRDIAWGCDIAPDLLWNIAKIGGADTRYLLADAQKTVEAMQTLLADQFCSRFWVYSTAKALKAGTLRACQDPEWWKHSWQAEQKLTVDIGRDGKLYLDMHKSGMISLKRWFSSSLGASWEPEMRDYLDERKWIIDEIDARGLTYDEAFPPAPGAQNITQREQTTGTPPEEMAPAERPGTPAPPGE
jgi:capsid protein